GGRACTLGGMAANNASGPHAVRWGTTSAYVLGAEVVLADGSVIVTGGEKSKALKSSSGLDLTKLFVGSEGTLGILTRLRLRVQPKPPARAVCLAAYASVDDTVLSLDDLFAAGILPSTAELLDRSAVEAIQRDRKSTRLNSSHGRISYAVFCWKRKRTSLHTSSGSRRIGRLRASDDCGGG